MRVRGWIAGASVVVVAVSSMATVTAASAASNSPVVTAGAVNAYMPDSPAILRFQVNRQAKAIVGCTVAGADAAPGCGEVVESTKSSTTFSLSLRSAAWATGANPVTVTVQLSDGGSASATTQVKYSPGLYEGCLELQGIPTVLPNGLLCDHVAPNPPYTYGDAEWFFQYGHSKLASSCTTDFAVSATWLTPGADYVNRQNYTYSTFGCWWSA